MTTKNEDLLRRYINEAYPAGAVCKLFDDILAAKDAEKEEAVEAERESIITAIKNTRRKFASNYEAEIMKASYLMAKQDIIKALTQPTNQ